MAYHFPFRQGARSRTANPAGPVRRVSSIQALSISRVRSRHTVPIVHNKACDLGKSGRDNLPQAGPPAAVVSGQWPVVSGQWPVVSGQWPAGLNCGHAVRAIPMPVQSVGLSPAEPEVEKGGWPFPIPWLRFFHSDYCGAKKRQSVMTLRTERERCADSSAGPSRRGRGRTSWVLDLKAVHDEGGEGVFLQGGSLAAAAAQNGEGKRLLRAAGCHAGWVVPCRSSPN